MRSTAAILILLENFTYPQDTRVRNEAESLASAGYGVTVLAPRGEGQPARETIAGVRVRRWRTVWASGSPLSYLAEYGVAHAQLLWRALLSLARGTRVVHISAPPDTLAAAGLLARIAGRRVVYDMHDSGPELFAAKFGQGRAGRVLIALLRLAQRAAVRCANEVVVTNESQRELLLGRAGARPERVTVVRNGPRAAEFAPPAAPRPGRLEQPRLVYVGTLDVQDGVLDLPPLLARPELANARLTVVGDGPAAGELRAAAASFGVAERIEMTGRVPHEQVARLIGEADICLDPAPATDLNEGSTMIKIAEYLISGRPVVAYDLRETRHTAAEAALYAAAGDASAFAALLAALAADGERRLALGVQARARGEALTWERSEVALRDLYARLL